MGLSPSCSLLLIYLVYCHKNYITKREMWLLSPPHFSFWNIPVFLNTSRIFLVSSIPGHLIHPIDICESTNGKLKCYLLHLCQAEIIMSIVLYYIQQCLLNQSWVCPYQAFSLRKRSIFNMFLMFLPMPPIPALSTMT